jgi:hypothetical protein
MIARQKRIAPPAIIKSLTVMPKNLNTAFPRKIKPIARQEAVTMDCNIIFVLSFRTSPSVSDAKIGNTPMASTATNIGMKDSSIFLSISLPYLSVKKRTHFD